MKQRIGSRLPSFTEAEKVNLHVLTNNYRVSRRCFEAHTIFMAWTTMYFFTFLFY